MPAKSQVLLNILSFHSHNTIKSSSIIHYQLLMSKSDLPNSRPYSCFWSFLWIRLSKLDNTSASKYLLRRRYLEGLASKCWWDLKGYRCRHWISSYKSIENNDESFDNQLALHILRFNYGLNVHTYEKEARWKSRDSKSHQLFIPHLSIISVYFNDAFLWIVSVFPRTPIPVDFFRFILSSPVIISMINKFIFQENFVFCLQCLKLWSAKLFTRYYFSFGRANSDIHHGPAPRSEGH